MAYCDERISVEKSRCRSGSVEDFLLALDDMEWRQFDNMRQAVRTLRDQYAAMFDLITKNWQLICQPRNEDSMPLMY